MDKFNKARLLPLSIHKKSTKRNLTGGPVVKNVPVGTRDTGWIPGLERFHVLWSN